METGSSWNFDAAPVTYKCDLCLEHKTQAPVQLNDAHAICKNCFVSDLKPRFEAAQTSEQSWPVTFGTLIHPSSFPGFFTKVFLLSYAEKEKEYKTPTGDRIYCTTSSCGKFLGKTKTDGESIIACSCGSKTCMGCKAIVREAETHTCHTTTTAVDAFEGLRLGHDYRRCPRCQLPVELAEACNHVKCRCGQEFCFVCGLPAFYGSTYWWPGGCPRYNLPGPSNAQYDTTSQAHVEQLRPDRGPPSALLVQAMDVLAIDRPAPQPPTPQQQEEQRRGREAQNEAWRRAANDIAARMGLWLLHVEKVVVVRASEVRGRHEDGPEGAR